jgi:hypothetical protein
MVRLFHFSTRPLSRQVGHRARQPVHDPGRELKRQPDASLAVQRGALSAQDVESTSISVTVNGVTTTPALYYASSAAVAGVLPSTPVGTGTITLSYNGQSSQAPIQVVASAVGLDTLNGNGAGAGVVTDSKLQCSRTHELRSAGIGILRVKECTAPARELASISRARS